jgi:hypothetical protein
MAKTKKEHKRVGEHDPAVLSFIAEKSISPNNRSSLM